MIEKKAQGEDVRVEDFAEIQVSVVTVIVIASVRECDCECVCKYCVGRVGSVSVSVAGELL